MGLTLDFLEEYGDGVRILSHNELENVIGDIPSLWFDIVRAGNSSVRVMMAIRMWEQYMSDFMPKTIAYMKDYLVDVVVVDNNGVFSLLYVFRADDGVLCYEGPSPHVEINNDVLGSVWSKIPESLRVFYKQVHNGFYDFTSESMGLLPLDSITYLGDDDLEWSIIEDLEEPLQINISSSFGFFSNGMGDYIVIDYKDCKDNKAAFWSAKRQPKYNIHFWSYVDAWTKIGLSSV